MPKSMLLGEFEHLVLLAVVRLGDEAHASGIRAELTAATGRAGTRGALYRTLDRLEDKGFVTWSVESDLPRRGGNPRRLFSITPAGAHALRACRQVFQRLWTGMDEVFGDGE